MNVRTLIKHLEDLPGNLTVYLSSDEEGNHYRSFEWSPSAMFMAGEKGDHVVFNDLEEAEQEGYPDAEEVVIIG